MTPGSDDPLRNRTRDLSCSVQPLALVALLIVLALNEAQVVPSTTTQGLALRNVEDVAPLPRRSPRSATDVLSHNIRSGQTPSPLLGKLLLYLVQEAARGHVNLVYDSSVYDISSQLPVLHRETFDVSVSSCSPFRKKMKSILRATRGEPSSYFLLCPFSDTLQIFEQIRQGSLESTSALWFLLAEDFETEPLLRTLREGTQVFTIERLSHNSYALLTTRVNRTNQIKVGRWKFENGQGRSFLSERIFPPLNELYSDFGARELVVSTVDNWPFVKVRRSNGRLYPAGGIDFNVLDTVAERLNFTYRLVEPPDGQWGYPSPDGTISGMIGMAARHEVHFALSEITITDGRETVVDFTTPYHFDAIAITSRAPKQRGKALAIFWPFSFEVWLLLVAVVIATGPVIYMFLEGSHWMKLSLETFRLQEVVFAVFRAMMVQGNRLVLSSFPVRLAFMCWYIFCLLISALYGGTLTAFLIIPAYEKPINSLVDLVAEAKESGFILTIMKDTSQESILKEATEGIYKEVWDFAFDPNKSHVATQSDGFSRALIEKSGYVTTQFISEIRTMRRGKHLYYIGRETFYPQGFGIACPSGSPYREAFETITNRLFEGGLVAKWCQDELIGTRSSTSDSDEEEQEVVQAIALDHLQAAFFLLAFGYALAFVILLLEALSAKAM